MSATPPDSEPTESGPTESATGEEAHCRSLEALYSIPKAKKCARGTGTFLRSRIALGGLAGYRFAT